ncbi:hypothetical protein A3L11_03520 [Thermococcus siculi]|uniref:Uncharacterized protein n=1 Tax=Thermococcus siculi TaxID=72803 RepID=A0A2Z2MIX5_9EURY|nr:hypothetical protein [Thermococcus siculi]ASJ08349.1 hypothetical protein A3L11_03520 [Thermococcus siculi]
MEWIGVILPFLAILAAVYIVSSGEAGRKISLLVLSVLSAGVVLYVRLSFGRYFTTIDESYYVSLLGDPRWYRTSIVSGYVTPFLLHVFRSLFATPVDEVVWYSAIAAVVYILLIFWVYKAVGLSSRHSLISLLILLMTPLYIWSVIQVRPQQAGLLVGLLIIALFVRLKPGKALFFGGSALYVLLVFSHVLSFIVYSLLLVSYLSVLVLFGEEMAYRKKYLVLAGSVILSWIVFLLFPYSRPILKNMTWLFNNLFHVGLSVKAFSALSAGMLVILLLGWYLILIHIPGRLTGTLSAIVGSMEKVEDAYRRVDHKLFALLALMLVFGVLYVQFMLGAQVYARVYQGSPLALLLFQMGNLVFALLYLRGVFLSTIRGRFGDLELLSLLMIPIAGAFLLVSFFMPRGNGIWGFHNWLIRALQYFVPLAAPLVGRQIMEDVDSANIEWERVLVSVFLALIIMISVLNTARIPGVYDYDAVWSHELVELCGDFGGIYVPRGESSLYSSFVENNLLKACGNGLSLDERGPLVVSSDGFYISPTRYSTLTIGEFGGLASDYAGRLVVMSGGDAFRSSYVVSLLPGSVFLPLDPDDCPLGKPWLSRPVLLIGGPVSNPCTRELEKVGALKVGLGNNYVTTLHSAYSIPAPEKWWDVREGLFVIHSLRYKGVPILLVEGTNLDATLAGVYYLMNAVYPRMGYYGSVHYIVGKWEETDGMVIDAAKGVPTDTNGFSPGDRITVLETG